MTPTDYLGSARAPLVGMPIAWVEWVRHGSARMRETTLVGIVRGVVPDLTTLLVESVGYDELVVVRVAPAGRLAVRVVHSKAEWQRLARNQIARSRRG